MYEIEYQSDSDSSSDECSSSDELDTTIEILQEGILFFNFLFLILNNLILRLQ